MSAAKATATSPTLAKCGGNIVALCDVDGRTSQTQGGNFPEARKFADFRKMLEEMDKSIDAVTISTPDHIHGIAAMTAMKMGKHVYCQKPLTQTVFEARELAGWRRKRNSPPRWAIRAVPRTACAAPSKSSNPA